MHTMKHTLAVFSFLLSQPTPVYGQALKEVTISDLEMLVSAHFLATEAGEKILADGCTAAVDAMIAFQTVLGLVSRRGCLYRLLRRRNGQANDL
jgi:gamma-glutamyltranspeptidase